MSTATITTTASPDRTDHVRQALLWRISYGGCVKIMSPCAAVDLCLLARKQIGLIGFDRSRLEFVCTMQPCMSVDDRGKPVRRKDNDNLLWLPNLDMAGAARRRDRPITAIAEDPFGPSMRPASKQDDQRSAEEHRERSNLLYDYLIKAGITVEDASASDEADRYEARHVAAQEARQEVCEHAREDAQEHAREEAHLERAEQRQANLQERRARSTRRRR